MMASIIQNMQQAVSISEFPQGGVHQTGGANTACERVFHCSRSCVSGDAPPVLIGEACAEVLKTLYTNLYTRDARNGAFPVVERRDVSQQTSLASLWWSNKKAVHRCDARPSQMVGTERFELPVPLCKEVQDMVMPNHQNALYTDSCAQGTTNDKYRRRYL